MKTLRTFVLGIVVLAILVVGATFALPGTVTVERSAEIARPPSIVYALVSDLNAYQQFSPWTGGAVTGAAGPGQKLTWAGPPKGVLIVTETKPYESVAASIDMGAPSKTGFKITPTESGSKVAWSFEQTNGLNPIARVQAFLGKAVIAKNFDAGLAKLKKVAEALPNVDLTGLSVETVEIAARPFIYTSGQISDADGPAIHAEVVRALKKADAVLTLADKSSTGSGVLVVDSHANGLITYRAGMPIEKIPTPEEIAAMDGAAKFQFGEFPGGRFVKAVSDPKDPGKTWGQMAAYLQLMQLTPKGPPQEAFPNGYDGPTEIMFPIG
jgi:hypothetical protein